MLNKIILGVTTLVILLAVTMPAMGEVVYLTNSNKFPAGEFNVSVNLDGEDKNISVELLKYPSSITPLGFEKFTYNLSTKVATVSEGNLSWDKNVGEPNADGFGNFLSNKVKLNCGGICHAPFGYGITNPLVFTLENTFNPSDIKNNENDQGSTVAVHLIFRLNEGNCTFCTWISDGVARSQHMLGHAVNAGADQMMDEGDLVTINLNFKDGFTKGHDGHTDGCSGEEGSDYMGSDSSGPDSGDLDGSGGFKHGYCEPHDHTVTIDWGDGMNETIYSAVSTMDLVHTYNGNGTYMVNVTVTDQYGRVGTDAMQVTVVSIDTPMDPVLINTPITASAVIPEGMLPDGCEHDTYTDSTCSGEHPSPWEWDWGDGSKTTGEIKGNNVTGSHTYSSTGIYTITLNVAYNKSMEAVNMAARSADYVVVYNPDGGFVTGGGWINSPQGAYSADTDLTGKVNFGFVSKYNKGASKPIGSTEFQFKLADLSFHSVDYQWLVIADTQAKYKGTGTINGAGNYGFILTASDSAVKGGGKGDTFRIQIWNIDALDTVVYDNGASNGDDTNAMTAISGGSIQVYKG